jgi:hypothetical protein
MKKRKKRSTRNPYARSLSGAAFKPRVVEDNRQKKKEVAARAEMKKGHGLLFLNASYGLHSQSHVLYMP